jgi:hypothetical protein
LLCLQFHPHLKTFIHVMNITMNSAMDPIAMVSPKFHE